MKLSKQTINDVLVIVIENKEANLSKSEQFKELIFEDIEDGAHNLVISFQNVEYIDSSFLGALVAILKKLLPLKGQLVLTHLNDDILNLFELTRLDKIFTIESNLEISLKKF
ncbi:STAS domain-containing protein [Pedobacter immunditicola]|uniref:STAS domain-containing protein n=1 Tax=Pedobacter immunditicola TaxID=3133440 RepID=UPI0030959957